MLRLSHLLIVATAILAIPVVVVSWGSIEDIRYKTKGSDGNLWASKMGHGYMVRGHERKDTITFTFDDGPDHRTTPVLLDQLDRYGIKAAFFINGAKFHPRTAGGPENKQVLRQIHSRGHFLGNHTFNHKDITTLDTEGWNREVVQVEQVISSITGRRPWLFRPPFGRADNKSLERLAKEAYTVVMWNLDPLDWKAKDAADLLKRVKLAIEENPSGGVLLMHDTNSTTIKAFPLIVEWIEERNERLRAEIADRDCGGRRRFGRGKRMRAVPGTRAQNQEHRQ